MRRLLLLLAAAALACSASAAGSLQPVRRGFGELNLPRVRAGRIEVPAGHANGRVRVIVRLGLPPLAAWSYRGLQSTGGVRRLDVGNRSSRAYVARVRRAQDMAVAALRRAIPEARVGRRFAIVLDGLTVTLPARRLPALARLGFVTRIYPSSRFTLTTNGGPQIIGSDVLAATSGARGDGIKIAVVDDGIDENNPFFAPAGFDYPAGFPRGDTRYTTPKVIVARSFPGPNAGKAGRLPLDPKSSFHGTHVAGIAAGDAGTSAPAGHDHPAVADLTGVAPRAWLGNYRVFTVPTPLGHVANTPEIVAAFEAAVADGMDVINFSGGGAQSEPANDPLVETIRNVAAAGVVPVIAAGNDRDDFGLGTVDSPGTAPDAISVAAVSNDQVFAPTLSVTLPGAPVALQQVPLQADSNAPPSAWAKEDQTLVDIGTLVGTDGAPVDRLLCGAAGNPNGLSSPLAAHSLDGTIALVTRGVCSFTSKARRAGAAGATGIVLVDNRPCEADGIPLRLQIPGGMIADLDGARLRALLAVTAGRAPIRIRNTVADIVTGRSGVITSFSSAGPVPFGHALKPDVAAPGGQILSATLPGSGGPFAVFDGTSMATPHIAGAAALLRQLHRGWSTEQIKSALVSTAGPAWADTGRLSEAPVLLEGGGLASLPRAADPELFTDPVSLSFGDLNVTRGAASKAMLVRLSDAGNGAGTWAVSLQSQAATAGSGVSVTGTVSIAPGGEADLPVVAHADAGARQGPNYGFVVLTKDGVTRRVPYAFFVVLPALQQLTPLPLKRLVRGTTLGASRVAAYGFPSAPFGPAPDYYGAPMQEDGSETLYVTHLNEPAANIGVSVVSSSRDAQIDPFFLGSANESDVQGQAGTPVNVNDLMSDFKVDVGAAGAAFPLQQTFYVAVDSGRDRFTGKLLAGSYVLRSWVNDVTAPRVRLLTTRVAAGRPTIVVRATDASSGVDPSSLTFGYRGLLVGATEYDPETGLAVLPLPRSTPRLAVGSTHATFTVSDFQEAKNVNSSGPSILPNTRFARFSIKVVNGPTLAWLLPNRCVRSGKTTRLAVAAGSTKQVRSVSFFEAPRIIAVKTKGGGGLYGADWHPTVRGRHRLTATVTDRSGRSYAASATVRVC